jgi:hypothetical protein
LPRVLERDESVLYVATKSPQWAQYTLDFAGDRLRSVDAKIAGLTAEDVSRAWGAPLGAGPELFVLDRARGVHALTELRPEGMPLELTIAPMIELASLVGHDPTKVAGIQVIGRPLGDVMHDFAPRAQRQASDHSYELPATEYGRGPTTLSFHSDGAVVDSWTLEGLDHSALETCKQTWGTDPRVHIDDDARSVRVSPIPS